MVIRFWTGNTERRSHFRLREKEDCFGFEHNGLEEKKWGPDGKNLMLLDKMLRRESKIFLKGGGRGYVYN